jgi:hypothetical protein
MSEREWESDGDYLTIYSQSMATTTAPAMTAAPTGASQIGTS